MSSLIKNQKLVPQLKENTKNAVKSCIESLKSGQATQQGTLKQARLVFQLRSYISSLPSIEALLPSSNPGQQLSEQYIEGADTIGNVYRLAPGLMRRGLLPITVKDPYEAKPAFTFEGLAAPIKQFIGMGQEKVGNHFKGLIEAKLAELGGNGKSRELLLPIKEPGLSEELIVSLERFGLACEALFPSWSPNSVTEKSVILANIQYYSELVAANDRKNGLHYILLALSSRLIVQLKKAEFEQSNWVAEAIKKATKWSSDKMKTFDLDALFDNHFSTRDLKIIGSSAKNGDIKELILNLEMGVSDDTLVDNLTALYSGKHSCLLEALFSKVKKKPPLELLFDLIDELKQTTANQKSLLARYRGAAKRNSSKNPNSHGPGYFKFQARIRSQDRRVNLEHLALKLYAGDAQSQDQLLDNITESILDNYLVSYCCESRSVMSFAARKVQQDLSRTGSVALFVRLMEAMGRQTGLLKPKKGSKKTNYLVHFFKLLSKRGTLLMKLASISNNRFRFGDDDLKEYKKKHEVHVFDKEANVCNTFRIWLPGAVNRWGGNLLYKLALNDKFLNYCLEEVKDSKLLQALEFLREFKDLWERLGSKKTEKIEKSINRVFKAEDRILKVTARVGGQNLKARPGKSFTVDSVLSFAKITKTVFNKASQSCRHLINPKRTSGQYALLEKLRSKEVLSLFTKFEQYKLSDDSEYQAAQQRLVTLSHETQFLVSFGQTSEVRQSLKYVFALLCNEKNYHCFVHDVFRTSKDQINQYEGAEVTESDINQLPYDRVRLFTLFRSIILRERVNDPLNRLFEKTVERKKEELEIKQYGNYSDEFTVVGSKDNKAFERPDLKIIHKLIRKFRLTSKLFFYKKKPIIALSKRNIQNGGIISLYVVPFNYSDKLSGYSSLLTKDTAKKFIKLLIEAYSTYRKQTGFKDFYFTYKGFQGNWLFKKGLWLIKNKVHPKYLVKLYSFSSYLRDEVGRDEYLWNESYFYDIFRPLAENNLDEVADIIAQRGNVDMMKLLDLLNLSSSLTNDSKKEAFGLHLIHAINRKAKMTGTARYSKIERLYQLTKDVEFLENKTRSDLREYMIGLIKRCDDEGGRFEYRLKPGGEDKSHGYVLEYVAKLGDKQMGKKYYQRFHSLVSRAMYSVKFIRGLGGMPLDKPMLSLSKKLVSEIAVSELESVELEKSQIASYKQIVAGMLDLVELASDKNGLVFGMLGWEAGLNDDQKYYKKLFNQKYAVLYLSKSSFSEKVKYKIYSVLEPRFKDFTSLSAYQGDERMVLGGSGKLSDDDITEMINLHSNLKSDEKPDKKRIEKYWELSKHNLRLHLAQKPENAKEGSSSKFQMVMDAITRFPRAVAFRAIAYYLANIDPGSAKPDPDLIKIIQKVVECRREPLLLNIFDYVLGKLSKANLDALVECLTGPLKAECEVGPQDRVKTVDFIWMHMVSCFRRLSPILGRIRDERMEDYPEETRDLVEMIWRPKTILFLDKILLRVLKKSKVARTAPGEFEAAFTPDKEPTRLDQWWKRYIGDNPELPGSQSEPFDFACNEFLAMKGKLKSLTPFLAKYSTVENEAARVAIFKNLIRRLSFTEIQILLTNGSKEHKDDTETVFDLILASMIHGQGWLALSYEGDGAEKDLSLEHGFILCLLLAEKHAASKSKDKIKAAYNQFNTWIEGSADYKILKTLFLKLSVIKGYSLFKGSKLVKPLEKKWMGLYEAEARDYYLKTDYRFLALDNKTLSELQDEFGLKKKLEEKTFWRLTQIEIEQLMFKAIAKDSAKVLKFMGEGEALNSNLFGMRSAQRKRQRRYALTHIKIESDVVKYSIKKKEKGADVEEDFLRRKGYLMKKVMDEVEDAQGNAFFFFMKAKMPNDNTARPYHIRNCLVKENFRWIKEMKGSQGATEQAVKGRTLILTKPTFQETIGVNMFLSGANLDAKSQNLVKMLAETSKNLLIPKINLRNINDLIIHEIKRHLDFYQYIMVKLPKKRELNEKGKIDKDQDCFSYAHDEKEKVITTTYTLTNYKARLEKANKRDIVKKCLDAIAQKTFLDLSQNNSDVAVKRVAKFCKETGAKMPKTKYLDSVMFGMKQAEGPSLKLAMDSLKEQLAGIGVGDASKLKAEVGFENPNFEGKAKSDLYLMLRKNKHFDIKEGSKLMTEYQASYLKKKDVKIISKSDRNVEIFVKNSLIESHLSAELNKQVSEKVKGVEAKLSVIYSKSMEYTPLFGKEDIVGMIRDAVVALANNIDGCFMGPLRKGAEEQFGQDVEKILKKVMSMRVKLSCVEVIKNYAWGVRINLEYERDDVEKWLAACLVPSGGELGKK